MAAIAAVTRAKASEEEAMGNLGSSARRRQNLQVHFLKMMTATVLTFDTWHVPEAGRHWRHKKITKPKERWTTHSAPEGL